MEGKSRKRRVVDAQGEMSGAIFATVARGCRQLLGNLAECGPAPCPPGSGNRRKVENHRVRQLTFMAGRAAAH